MFFGVGRSFFCANGKGEQGNWRRKGAGGLQTLWSHLAFKGAEHLFVLLLAHVGWLSRLLQSFKLLAVIFTLPLLSLLICKVPKLKANLSTASNSHK